MNYETDYQQIIDCIDPSTTDRLDWVKVGMALKQENQPFEMFDRWSARDFREGQYKGTEATYKTWESFNNTGSGTVTGATLVEMARERGIDPFYKSSDSSYMGWDDYIKKDPEKEKSAANFFVPPKPKENLKEPFQIVRYLEKLFKPDDKINIITESHPDENGKMVPHGTGSLKTTAKEFTDRIRKYADSEDWFESAIGAYNKKSGVWIRVNPINGELKGEQKGISDRNVTRYENALIECDSLSCDEQIKKIKELKLPYKALVYSGSKSVHAIVRLDAKSIADYKDKLSWLMDYCIENGLPVDTQNKNPSRMTRLPGCVRGNRKQVLLETANPISFDEWKKQILVEKEADELPLESFEETCNDLPEKAPVLIEGVLRKGHKLLVQGPSKAGKSFSLIGLAIAIAEGEKWLAYQCRKGRVLYLNLEIDRPSFLHRVSDVYKAKGIEIRSSGNLDILNLRGKAEPLDALVPKLEVLIKRKQYDMIIIDPIYKVITGDENSASDMGKFCNLFDRLAKTGQCAVAYCHHHSKGSQAGKNSIDRSSGSGVFARDPDAIIDLTEIAINDYDREELEARMIEMIIDFFLKQTGIYQNLEKRDAREIKDRIAKQELLEIHFQQFSEAHEMRVRYEKKITEAREIAGCDAFRVSITLREFKSPPDINVFFKYPIHIKDETGYLEELFLVGDNSLEAMNKAKAEKTRKRSDKRREWYEAEREKGNMVAISDMQEHFSEAGNTVRKWADDQKDLKRENGWILYIAEDAPPKKQRGKGK